jgi:alkylation response protein AidB-like acyl-CoA dehydrogenase
MEFAFTEEQKMIRDTAEAFLNEVSDSTAVRAAMASERGFDNALWSRVCGEMFWQAIHLPESVGGMGLGYVELVAVLEQMGKNLLCSPFFATVCQGANAILVAGNDEQKAHYLAEIVEGKTATLAYTNSSSWATSAVEATYSQDGDDFILDGDYRYVIDGHTADFIVVAAVKKSGSNAGSIALFVVDSQAAGLSAEWLPTLDQTRKQAAISMRNVRVSSTALLAENAEAKLQTIIDLATIALSAEQMGGTQKVLDMAVEYTIEREQFGRKIASFQAIKHKAADMMCRAEVARSAVYYAACIADEALSGGVMAEELGEAASVAKAYCSEAYFKNTGECIQMFGGVGFTWEYDPHLYFKRAKASEHLLGNGSYHRERVATMLLDNSNDLAPESAQ